MSKQENSRLLPLTGVYNMRDLGGYATQDGKHTKWNMIIRSGDMAQLDNEGLEYLSNIPLKTIIDFRSSYERDAMPDKSPQSLVENCWLPIDAGDLGKMQPDSPESVITIMQQVYRSIICQYQNELKKFFRILEKGSNAPLLFHCSAGKDRTGIASALTLAALGVDSDTIMEDYMLSAEYIKGKYDFIIEKFPALAPLTTVRPEYLQAALDTINTQFGGMKNYLENILDVNVQHLRELYTE